MELIRKYGFVLAAIIIAVTIISIYAIREYKASKVEFSSQKNGAYESIAKTYGINEYSVVNISNDEMAKIYFDTYKKLVIRDIKGAYEKLDDDNKSKFSSIEKFNEYVNKLDILNKRATKYNIFNKNGYTVYVVYDSSNNYYAFKTNGVLQYTVYLDDTIEIR